MNKHSSQITPKIFNSGSNIWDQIWPAPAKINRFLHIIGQRSDGYHQLQSVFQFLTVADSLSFKPLNCGSIRLSQSIAGVDDKDNLVIKAATLLRQSFLDNLMTPSPTKTMGVEVTLSKVLPMGGGLGGGSSDAATTLLALNKLWNIHFSLEKLAQLGLKLGADVPFFIHGKTAFVEGVGEKITPFLADSPWILLLTPNCFIETAKIFSHPALTRNTEIIRIRDLAQADSNNLLGNFGRNDCEKVVSGEYPEVSRALKWLNQHKIARLTGTGACIFATFDNEQEARKIAARCPESFNALVSKSTNYSPVHRLLENWS